MKCNSIENRWLHLGAGNIFRVFLAAAAQDLIEAGHGDPGLAVCECYDEEIIPAVFTPYNNETIGVTLHADGNITLREITSIRDAFGCGEKDFKKKLARTVANLSLQLISLTITEKGYAVDAENVNPKDDPNATALEYLTAALHARLEANVPPIALVAMDNFAANGDVLHRALQTIAQVWEENGEIPTGLVDYINAQSYPWTMIDKITPHPSDEIAKKLTEMTAKNEILNRFALFVITKNANDSTINPSAVTKTAKSSNNAPFAVTKTVKSSDISPFAVTKTTKGTVIAPFVNAESAQYLVMEDNFPSGRPSFEYLTASGIYLTDRETVRKADHMKVCACLNPLHTLLGLAGMLLRYPTIAACMQNAPLVALARRAAAEALPVAAHPGIIDPQQFLDEVLTQRFPNPFIPDTPTRIATDSSQKIPVRFGQTLKARQAAGLPMDELTAIPFLVALWLRYRMGIGDDGAPLTLAPDPLAPPEVMALEGLPLGVRQINLHPVLSNEKLFGIDLYAAGLGERIETLFTKLASAPGAVKHNLFSAISCTR